MREMLRPMAVKRYAASALLLSLLAACQHDGKDGSKALSAKPNTSSSADLLNRTCASDTPPHPAKRSSLLRPMRCQLTHIGEGAVAVADVAAATLATEAA